MVIKKIHVEGYGKLKDLVIDFNDGINMVYGQNETGKSTLKRCILALWYGQEEIADTVNGISEYDMMKPWSDSPYRASMTYTLKNGRTFTISRDFEKGTVKIIDVGTGKDFTDTYPLNERGEPAFAKEHLGVTRSNFISSALIEHQHVHRADDVQALSASIMSLADSASEEHTYMTAVNRLNQALAAIGSENNTNTPLGKATADLEALRKSVEVCDKNSMLIAQLKRQLSELTSENELCVKKTDKLTYILRHKEKEKLFESIREMEQLEEEIPKLEQELRNITCTSGVSLTSLTELYSLRSKEEKTRQELEKLRGRLPDLQSDISKHREKYEEFKHLLEVKDNVLEIISLSESTEARKSVLQTKEKMLEQARMREKIAQEHFDKERKVFADFNNAEQYDMYVSELAVKLNKQDILKLKESDLERLQQEGRDKKRGIWIKRGIGGLVLLVGLLLGLYGFYPGMFAGDFTYIAVSGYSAFFILGLVSMLGGAGIWVNNFMEGRTLKTVRKKLDTRSKEVDELRNDVESAQNELKVLFKKIGALSIDELRKRYRDYTRSRIDLETSQQLVKTLEEEVEGLYQDVQSSQSLREFLVSFKYIGEGEPVTTETIRKFQEEYRTVKDSNVKLMELSKELETCESEIVPIESEWKRIRVEIDNILQCGSVESVEDYDKAYRRIQQQDRLRSQLDSLREKRKLLSSGQSLEEKRLRREQVDKFLTEMMENYPDFSGINPRESEEQQIQQEMEFLQHRIQEIATIKAQLDSKIEALTSETATDDKRYDIAEARKVRDHLIRHRKAIEMAITMITKTGKEFQEQYMAPQLARTTAHILNKITAKYSEVFIDKNMSVLVKSPELGDLVHPESLSRATIDQLYFALRLGIARTFSKGKESLPLIMDDPFTNADENRRRQAFEALVGIEKAHQVLFFTCSSHQKQDFARVLKDHKKLAKLYRVNELELIKPATAKPASPVQPAAKRQSSTTFLSLPQSFEMPKTTVKREEPDKIPTGKTNPDGQSARQ